MAAKRAEIHEVVLNNTGVPLEGASVQVNVRGGGAATVYEAETGGTTVANPIMTTAQGRIEGWLEEGSYDLVVSGTGITTYTQRFEAVSGANSPGKVLTTTGDLVYAESAGDIARLAIGSTGQVLKVAAGLPSWGSVGATLVTALPGSPSDGDEIIFTDSLTAPTYRWHLQYESGDSKWHFVGGAPLFAEVATQESTNSTTYAALATAGPAITLPLAGDYEVEVGCFTVQDGSLASAVDVFMSYDIGATGAVDADAAKTRHDSSQTGDTISRPRRKTGLTAVTLTAKYKIGASDTVNFANRWMRVTPVKLG